MRVITQDKHIDFPMDNFVFTLWINPVKIICYDKLEGSDYITVAKYSTKEKAQKVMKMLRNEYMKNGSKNVYFQFPADEDVIV
nr:MAG TPA: protein of unknown function (DUF5613) [Caudoviricetes sp.]